MFQKYCVYVGVVPIPHVSPLLSLKKSEVAETLFDMRIYGLDVFTLQKTDLALKACSIDICVLLSYLME